jgi:hypothetical protein
MPTYHTKFGGFVGLVFFESSNPLKLPWTTTKRSLNRESGIYLRTRNRMAAAARPVLTFMNKKYGPDLDTTPVEREIAHGTVSATPAQLATSTNTQFNVFRTDPKPKLIKRVQYDARITDLDKISKHLNQRSMTAGKIGEHTFKYFLDQEGLA